MIPMSLEQATALVRRMIGSNPNGSPNDPEIYMTTVATMLMSVPLPIGERAISTLIEDMDFFPAPRKIRLMLDDYWRLMAPVSSSYSTNQLDGPQEVRPTLEELIQKHGKNWGLNLAKETSKTKLKILSEIERANKIFRERGD